MGIRRSHPQGEKASIMDAERSNKSSDVRFEWKQREVKMSKARYCTKSKKGVSGDLFVSSCHTCLPGNESVS